MPHYAMACASGQDGDGQGHPEVHCNSCEGAGAALRTYLRAFVHKRYPHLYVATYEAMVNTKRITPTLIRRMCLRDFSASTGYT
jgi:hypothetical protein